MTKLLYVARKNLYHELLPHFTLAVLIMLLAPLVFSLNDLTTQMAAPPLEIIAVIAGAVILIPLFWLEQDKVLADILHTKQTPPAYVHCVRAAYSIISVFLIIAAFVGVMYLLKSDMTGKLYLGTVFSALFLGGLGLLAFSIVNNIAVAYMLPVIWYVICMMSGPKVKQFDVMMMMHGKIDGKPVQLAAGIIFIVLAVVIRSSPKAVRS